MEKTIDICMYIINSVGKKQALVTLWYWTLL